MATLNPFDLLNDDENGDPSEVIARASVTKEEPKKAAPKPAAKAAAPAAAPASNGVARSSAPAARGGARNNAPRPPREQGDVTESKGELRGPRESGDRRPRPDRRPRGGEVEMRRPRREFERQSGTGRGHEVKRQGAGKGNWGSAIDGEAAPVEGESEEVAAAPAGAEETPPEPEPEPDNELTLEEYEKVFEEKRKNLLAQKSEVRTVAVDEELSKLTVVAKKPNVEDEVFIKLKEDKPKAKDAPKQKDSSKAKPMSMNAFFNPTGDKADEIEKRYYGRGAARGGRGGRGGFGGGSRASAAPLRIDDDVAFPTLG